MADTLQISPPLSQGVGYGIIVGVGAAFAIGMSLMSWWLSKYMNEIQDSEMFMTAKHSVKTGLTASAVVSSWTIAATLLTSTTYGYDYGVSGPFWVSISNVRSGFITSLLPLLVCCWCECANLTILSCGY